MQIYQDDIQIDVSGPLAEDLLVKWGYNTKKPEIPVQNIEKILAELNVWGIPWKRTDTRWNS